MKKSCFYKLRNGYPFDVDGEDNLERVRVRFGDVVYLSLDVASIIGRKGKGVEL